MKHESLGDVCMHNHLGSDHDRRSAREGQFRPFNPRHRNLAKSTDKPTTTPPAPGTQLGTAIALLTLVVSSASVWVTHRNAELNLHADAKNKCLDPKFFDQL